MGTAILPGSRVGGEVVRAVNGLTGRWAATARDGTVLSAAGVWPLPAFLADGAAGPARTELGEALGLPADQAAGAARQLPGAPAGLPGVDTAVGLRTARTLELRPQWTAGLPATAHGMLTGDRISAVFDRPFGFLALQRHSRLVPAAGWVTDPLPFPEYPERPDEGCPDEGCPDDEYVNDAWESDK
ncbi:hypothetical protein A6P39_016940 [Streptomyces sp. FXJ1.172]|uniref:hypothetical protein n=1 Tax=Streptomyces sp. FXJ1.172 TaxID=710705 RepID=UPI0007CFD29C|nr:hypothetical protein [Streptomyces sp. FXJ1.172]WEO95573.1 hypothetical protein A6P39_016940 [Streptomyces sp. FXJ1.172]